MTGKKASEPAIKRPPKPDKAERLVRMDVFVDLVTEDQTTSDDTNEERNERKALAYFAKNTWIATERLPKRSNTHGSALNSNTSLAGGWPLHLVSAYHCPKLVNAMVSHGAPVNAVTSRGRNAIMLATEPLRGVDTDPTATVTALLRSGCRADIVDRDGVGVLYQKRVDIPPPLFRQLIKAGARINCYNSSGAHLFADFLSMAGDPIVVANSMALLEAGIDIQRCQGSGGQVGNALGNAIECGHFELAERMVALGANVRHRTHTGETLLHMTASPEAVSWLLDRAPDLLEATDYGGRTPVLQLSRSIEQNPGVRAFLQILVQMVNAGADLDRQEYQGSIAPTARQMLSRHPDHEVQAVWKSLMARELTRAAMAELGDQSTPNSMLRP